MNTSPQDLQHRLGRRVRQRRTDMGLTLEQLAQASGVSSRFVSEVEAGRANISIGRLSGIADALGTPLTVLLSPVRTGTAAAIERLLADASPAQLDAALRVLESLLGARTPRIVALLGVRGAGKSAVGAALAQTLDLPFVELDADIEARAGMSLGDIFTLHGEPFYRRLEFASLDTLIRSDQRLVVALPGGIVTSPRARDLIEGSCTAIWLRATAQEHWARVFAQGDTRPMAGREDAMAELRALMERRAPLYATAQLVAETSGQTPAQVAAALATELDARGLRP